MELPTIENKSNNNGLRNELEKCQLQLKTTAKDCATLIAENMQLKQEISIRIKTEAKLTQAKLKAEENDKLKTAFLANLSHEIRTPMNGIVGFASLLVDRTVDDESRNVYVEIINNSCNQLLSIINDIVDISRIESGQITLSETSFQLNGLIDELQMFFLPLAEKSNLKLLSTKELPDAESTITCDHTKIRQVLNNLLINAIKFTKKGEIKFGYRIVDNFVEFYVSDTGIGIKPDFQKLVFDRFQQAEAGDTNVYGGTGLGLSISKAFVELHGGKIWVQSTPGKGSDFYFTINNYSNITHQSKTVSIGIPIDCLAGKKILVAEDEESNFRFLNEILVGHGATVIRAVNGLKAVEICKNNADIDLILMDIKMPKMNGLEAVRIIKQISGNTTPIIVQTAYAYPEDRKRAMEYMCDDYITKPLNPDDLFKIIDKHIR